MQLSLGETRAASACATLVSSGFTCGSLGSQLLHLGSALPSSFAVNGVISTFCCLLVWRAASVSPAPVVCKAGEGSLALLQLCWDTWRCCEPRSEKGQTTEWGLRAQLSPDVNSARWGEPGAALGCTCECSACESSRAGTMDGCGCWESSSELGMQSTGV